MSLQDAPLQGCSKVARDACGHSFIAMAMAPFGTLYG